MYSKRLFFGIKLPLEIKLKIGKLQAEVMSGFSARKVKWTEQDNFHLTLHFLGGVQESEVANLQNIQVVTENFEIRMSQLLCFPDFNRPRVIALKIVVPDKGQKLYQELGAQVAELGYEVGDRIWQPHVTLGRIKDDLQKPCPKFDVNFEADVKIDSFQLFESHLESNGPRYEVVEEFQLKNNN